MTIATLLLVATLGLQAQPTATPSSQPTPSDRPQPQSPPPDSSPNRSSSGQVTSPSNPADPAAQSRTDAQRREDERKRNEANPSSRNQSGATSQTFNQQSTTQINQSQAGIAASTEADVQVKTVVQQIDAQGPAVVQKISTRFADVACSEENARLLVEALHNGSSVTLRGDDGKTATFTPNVKLGYGDAYLTLALAAEALQKAGISGCATPAQWQAVLMGGQLSGGTTRTTSVQAEHFPGILVLHSQGGWTQVAQTTNIELNQIVSQANTSLQIDNSQQLSPTGRSSDYDPYKTDGGKKEQNQNESKPRQETDAQRKQSHEMNPSTPDDPNHRSRSEPSSARPNQ